MEEGFRLWGLWETVREGSGDGASFSMQEFHRGTWEGASFPWGLRKITGLGRKPQPLRLHECEALATLRHVYLGSFFMDPKDIRGLSLRAMWNFFRRTGLSLHGPRKGAQRAGKAYVHRDRKGSTRTYSVLFYGNVCFSIWRLLWP
jgi:hypothetical protein